MVYIIKRNILYTIVFLIKNLKFEYIYGLLRILKHSIFYYFTSFFLMSFTPNLY